MRIFIRDGYTYEKPSGGEIHYGRNSFNEVDEVLGKKLIAEEIAVAASKDNVADPWPEPPPKELKKSVTGSEDVKLTTDDEKGKATKPIVTPPPDSVEKEPTPEKKSGLFSRRTETEEGEGA